jgi:hypothetical protein
MIKEALVQQIMCGQYDRENEVGVNVHTMFSLNLIIQEQYYQKVHKFSG